MLRAVYVYNELGANVRLPLDDSSEYVIKSIEGLGPVKANIVTTEYVGVDGGFYQNSKGTMRNIVIQIGFDPSYVSDDPYGELRRALYPYLLPKMQVRLMFDTDNYGFVEIIGYVESFEPSIFSAEPEVQISILCPDPNFYTGVVNTASRVGSGQLIVTNPGTVDTGMIFTLFPFYDRFATGTIFKVTRISPTYDTMRYIGPFFSVNTTIAFRANTTKGLKSAGWMDGYNPNNPQFFDPEDALPLLGYMENWIDLVPGENILQLDLPPTQGTPITASIMFTTRYAGL